MSQAAERTRRPDGARRAPLLALAALALVMALSAFVTIPAVASVPRAAAGQALAVASLGSSSAPAAALDAEPFALFSGDELARPARSSERELHALQGVSLLSEEPRREPAPRLPETRIGAFEFLGGTLIGVERGVSLELRWGSEFSCFGTAEGSVRFGQEDPAGTHDSPNRYQALLAAWSDVTDPYGLLTNPQKQAQIAENLLAKKLKAQGWHVFWGGQVSHNVLGGGPDVFAYNAKTGDLAFFDDKNWLSKNRVYRSKAQNLLDLTADKGRKYLRKAELLVLDSNMPNAMKDRIVGRLAARDFSRYVTSAASESVVNSVSRQLERDGVLFYDLEKAASTTVGDAAKGLVKRIPFVKIGLAVLIFATVEDKSEAAEMVLDPTGALGSSRTVSTEEELRANYEQMFLPQLALELGLGGSAGSGR